MLWFSIFSPHNTYISFHKWPNIECLRRSIWAMGNEIRFSWLPQVGHNFSRHNSTARSWHKYSGLGCSAIGGNSDSPICDIYHQFYDLLTVKCILISFYVTVAFWAVPVLEVYWSSRMTFSNCGAFTWCGMFSSTTNIALGMSREIPRDAMFATRKYTTLMYISSSHGWACGGTCVIVGPQILRRRVLQSSYTLNQLHLILYPERPCSKYTPPLQHVFQLTATEGELQAFVTIQRDIIFAYRNILMH